jgi:hypothetical protein
MSWFHLPRTQTAGNDFPVGNLRPFEFLPHSKGRGIVLFLFRSLPSRPNLQRVQVFPRNQVSSESLDGIGQLDDFLDIPSTQTFINHEIERGMDLGGIPVRARKVSIEDNLVRVILLLQDDDIEDVPGHLFVDAKDTVALDIYIQGFLYIDGTTFIAGQGDELWGVKGVLFLQKLFLEEFLGGWPLGEQGNLVHGLTLLGDGNCDTYKGKGANGFFFLRHLILLG